MNSSAQFEVNIDYLNDNIDKLFTQFDNYQYKIADLRNNAFGMGIYVVRYLVEKGFDYIFTTTLKEAIEIRNYNQEIPILISKKVDEDYIYDAINNNVTLTIDDLDYLKSINQLELKDELKIHILINNGVNNLGLDENELEIAMELINGNDYLTLEGVYTNITTYGFTDVYYYNQTSRFAKIVDYFDTKNLMVHANEPIMYHKKLDCFNGIKFDVSLWGLIQIFESSFSVNRKKKKIDAMYQENTFQDLNLDLDVVFAITARIEKIINVKQGTLIGRNYLTNEDMRVGILDIGHKDGTTKALKVVVVNQEICEVLTDDIDRMFIKVSNDVSVGDKVYLISDFNNIDSVLFNLKTNNYYLLSILNTNLKRVYIKGEEEEELYY